MKTTSLIFSQIFSLILSPVFSLSIILMTHVLASATAQAEDRLLAFCTIDSPFEPGDVQYYEYDGKNYVSVQSGGLASDTIFTSEFQIANDSADRCTKKLSSTPLPNKEFINMTMNSSTQSFNISDYHFAEIPFWIQGADRNPQNEKIIPLLCIFDPEFKKQLETCQ
jgi:hypothetical protein